jgi:uncharacterized phiE125 gp8 family phage protein
MMLIEETPIPDGALPVAAFRNHLRLGSGFGTDMVQDDVLSGFLRAATTAIEARLSKALLTRQFTLTVQSWQQSDHVALTVSPVITVDAVDLVASDGSTATVATSSYWLARVGADPKLWATGTSLPNIPDRGHARITFVAGMANDANGLPADLQQAVLMLAAHYYEYRNDTGLGDGCMPFGVTSLIQRYRPIRIGVGVGQ